VASSLKLDMDIKESDWKVLRRLHSVALGRYCQRVPEEVKLATACNYSYHDCYLKVYRLIQDRDKTMALLGSYKNRETSKPGCTDARAYETLAR
jgi:hypothetical protein